MEDWDALAMLCAWERFKWLVSGDTETRALKGNWDKVKSGRGKWLHEKAIG